MCTERGISWKYLKLKSANRSFVADLSQNVCNAKSNTHILIVYKLFTTRLHSFYNQKAVGIMGER